MYPYPTLVAQTVENLPAMQETWVHSLGQEDPLEEGIATHSSILTWWIPWTEKPSRLQSNGLQKSQTWLSNYLFQPLLRNISVFKTLVDLHLNCSGMSSRLVTDITSLWVVWKASDQRRSSLEGGEAEKVIWKRKDSSGTREGEAGKEGTKEAKAELSFRIYLVELIAGRRY